MKKIITKFDDTLLLTFQFYIPCTEKEKLNVQLYMCANYLCKSSKKFFPKSYNWIVDKKKHKHVHGIIP